MDFYQVLKVSPNASRKEIEDAYNRLIKESRYNTTIDKREIEKAFRILTDPQQKAVYDSIQDFKSKKIAAAQNVAAAKPRRRRPLTPQQRLRRLLVVLAILTIITGAYYTLRFGHHLKKFEEGDVLYLKGTSQRMGRIIDIDEDHKFGKVRRPGYLVESGGKRIWLPQNDVKSRCYAK